MGHLTLRWSLGRTLSIPGSWQSDEGLGTHGDNHDATWQQQKQGNTGLRKEWCLSRLAVGNLIKESFMEEVALEMSPQREDLAR